MNPLAKIIIDKINKEGPITFETFMDMALYYPGLGYYSSPNIEIGKKGDFYTSPHLHSIFGAMIGKQLMEMWETIGRPGVFHAVEMGAGLGYLCKDIFEYLRMPSNDTALRQNKIDFFESLRYVIIEPYLHFENKQRELLRDTLECPTLPLYSKEMMKDKITWINSLTGLKSITGCIFSNELLDAFPVHVIEMEDELKEVYVNFDGSDFIEEKGKVSSDEIITCLTDFAVELQPDYRTEINLKIKDWLQNVSLVLSNGFVLTIDYGYPAKEYFSEERTSGTLLCYHKHLYNDNPYQHIGEQDITAHVNFSSVKKWGEDYGFKTVGYSPQGTYLISSGIDKLIVERYADSPDYLSEVSKIKGLIMPQGMGESHNILIQYRGEGSMELCGFSMRNNTGHL